MGVGGGGNSAGRVLAADSFLDAGMACFGCRWGRRGGFSDPQPEGSDVATPAYSRKRLRARRL